MTRKGGITRKQLDRQWPHHVALSAEAARGPANAETVRGFAASLRAAPLTYHLTREDRDYVVFCFPSQEAAQAFQAWVGGELLPVADEPRRRR
jgi:hypothetical protein